MEVQSKRMWIVALANIAVVGLWVGNIFSAQSDWLFYCLPPIGLAMSAPGLWFIRCIAPGASRFIVLLVNGCTLVLNLVIILLCVPKLFGGTTARFVVPNGYEGDVYVVETPDGESVNRTLWGRTVIYQIPQGGILRTQELSRDGYTWLEYYAERPDGSLEVIDNRWAHPGEDYRLRSDGSVELFPSDKSWYREQDYEDRQDDSLDEKVIWPFIGDSLTTPRGCSIAIEHFYVGTRAHLLSKYRQIDFARYLREHPILKSIALKP